MKRITCSILSAAVVCGFAWLWGYDFNERGATALIVAYIAAAAGIFVYMFPGWTE